MISTALKYFLIDKCLDVFFDKVSTNLAIVPVKGRYVVGQRVETIVVREEDMTGFIIYWGCNVTEVNPEWITIDYNMAFHTSFFSSKQDAKEEYAYRKTVTGDDPDVIHSIDNNCVTTTWKSPDSQIIMLDEIVDSNIMRVSVK